jgi:hypothetical protein
LTELRELSSAGSGSGRLGPSDSDVPVAAREIQRRKNQERGCPSVGAVREEQDAADGQDTATGNTGDPRGAEVAVLPLARSCAVCRIAGEMPTTRAGLSQRCCRWVRSSGCLLLPVVSATRSPIKMISLFIGAFSRAAVASIRPLGRGRKLVNRWPLVLSGVPPRCPRMATNSQRSPPAASGAPERQSRRRPTGPDRRTDYERWSSLNRSGRPRPELLMRRNL